MTTWKQETTSRPSGNSIIRAHKQEKNELGHRADFLLPNGGKVKEGRRLVLNWKLFLGMPKLKLCIFLPPLDIRNTDYPLVVQTTCALEF